MLKRIYTNSLEVSARGDIILPTGNAISPEQLHYTLDRALDELEHGKSGAALVTLKLLIGGKKSG